MLGFSHGLMVNIHIQILTEETNARSDTVCVYGSGYFYISSFANLVFFGCGCKSNSKEMIMPT